jgi:hypothetical protein
VFLIRETFETDALLSEESTRYLPATGVWVEGTRQRTEFASLILRLFNDDAISAK